MGELYAFRDVADEHWLIAAGAGRLAFCAGAFPAGAVVVLGLRSALALSRELAEGSDLHLVPVALEAGERGLPQVGKCVCVCRRCAGRELLP